MPQIKILQHFPTSENYEVGEEYDMTNPWKLIEEGKVALVTHTKTKKTAKVKPVTPEPIAPNAISKNETITKDIKDGEI